MAILIVKSPAKLNLYLSIRGKREDGYHEIETVFERIDLTDEIRFSENESGGIELFCNNAEVPLGPHSLVYKSVELVRKELSTLKHVPFFTECPAGRVGTSFPKGISITIDKRIPIASGLGGGSSNAASIISGLDKFWGLNLTQPRLLDMGRGLGADVCFFLHDAPLGLGKGRGDEVVPLPGPERPLGHILVVPEEKISSKEAYDRKDKRGLTEPKNGIKIVIRALDKGDLALLRGSLYNGLEEPVAESYLVIREIKQALESLGLEETLMSGSGPAVFGLTYDTKEAMRLKKELDSKHRDWKTFVVSTY